MNGVICGVDIENDLFRRRGVGFNKEFDEEFGKFGILLFTNSIFETRKGGRRTERRLFVSVILDGGEKSGISPHGLLIVDVFVGERDRVETLRQKFVLLVNGVPRITRIGNELIDAVDELKILIDLPEENGPGVGGEGTAAKVDGDCFGSGGQGYRNGRFHGTLCLGRWSVKCVAIPLQLH